MVIWALDAVSSDGKDCCHALLPARVIAGPGAASDATSARVDRAPWIRISRLRIARLRCANQRSGDDKKHDNQHARHSPSPYRRCRLPSLSVVVEDGGLRIRWTGLTGAAAGPSRKKSPRSIIKGRSPRCEVINPMLRRSSGAVNRGASRPAWPAPLWRHRCPEAHHHATPRTRRYPRRGADR
jgi:hypothetical protein